MSEQLYCCSINGNESGPFNAAQLKQLVEEGRLSKTDSVRRKQSANWHPAVEIKWLFSDTASSPSSGSAIIPPLVQQPQQPPKFDALAPPVFGTAIPPSLNIPQAAGVNKTGNSSPVLTLVFGLAVLLLIGTIIWAIRPDLVADYIPDIGGIFASKQPVLVSGAMSIDVERVRNGEKLEGVSYRSETGIPARNKQRDVQFGPEQQRAWGLWGFMDDELTDFEEVRKIIDVRAYQIGERHYASEFQQFVAIGEKTDNDIIALGTFLGGKFFCTVENSSDDAIDSIELQFFMAKPDVAFFRKILNTVQKVGQQIEQIDNVTRIAHNTNSPDKVLEAMNTGLDLFAKIANETRQESQKMYRDLEYIYTDEIQIGSGFGDGLAPRKYEHFSWGVDVLDDKQREKLKKVVSGGAGLVAVHITKINGEKVKGGSEWSASGFRSKLNAADGKLSAMMQKNIREAKKKLADAMEEYKQKLAEWQKEYQNWEKESRDWKTNAAENRKKRKEEAVKGVQGVVESFRTVEVSYSVKDAVGKTLTTFQQAVIPAIERATVNASFNKPAPRKPSLPSPVEIFNRNSMAAGDGFELPAAAAAPAELPADDYVNPSRSGGRNSMAAGDGFELPAAAAAPAELPADDYVNPSRSGGLIVPIDVPESRPRDFNVDNFLSKNRAEQWREICNTVGKSGDSLLIEAGKQFIDDNHRTSRIIDDKNKEIEDERRRAEARNTTEQAVAEAETAAAEAEDWRNKARAAIDNYNDADTATRKAEAAKQKAEQAARRAKSAAQNYDFGELTAKADAALKKASSSVVDAKRAVDDAKEHDPNYIANLDEWVEKQEARPGYRNDIYCILEYGTPGLQKKLELANTAVNNAEREGFADGIAAAQETLREIKAEITATQDRIAKMKFYYDGDFDVQVENDDGRTTIAAISFDNMNIYNGLRGALNSQLWRFCFPTNNCNVSYRYKYNCTVTGDTNTMKVFCRNAKNYVCRVYLTDYRRDRHCNIVRFEIRQKGDGFVPLQPIHWGVQPIELPDNPVRRRPFPVQGDNNNNDGNAPVNANAQQIQNVVNDFLAMNPNGNVLIPLNSFRQDIIPQINTGIAQGQNVITVRNEGFLPRGNDEVFVVDAFLKASKGQQFETIWRTACGKVAVQDTGRQTPKQKQIVAACKAFSLQIAVDEKKKQPPAASENNDGVVPQEPPKQ